jgi:predicted O-linked N-acetylglucosamine transferase (SPINDLY family)
MGVLDCVANDAEDYVRIAVRIGTDPSYRDEVRTKIQKASGVLFKNEAGVRDLELFLRDAVARIGGSR